LPAPSKARNAGQKLDDEVARVLATADAAKTVGRQIARELSDESDTYRITERGRGEPSELATNGCPQRLFSLDRFAVRSQLVHPRYVSVRVS
jgi:hypothetical protein